MNRPITLSFDELLLDDRALAYLELEKDPVFPHLSAAQRLFYLDYALEAGRAQAALYRGETAFDLAEKFGVKVVIQNEENRIAGLTLRAIYDAQTKTITLFQASIEEMQQNLSPWLKTAWDIEQIMALHLAHELFHHLEATQIELIDRQLPAITTFRLGRLKMAQSRARRCREIAAHAFAKELLDFPFFPSAADWIFAISRQECTLSQFQNELHRARKMERGGE